MELNTIQIEFARYTQIIQIIVDLFYRKNNLLQRLVMTYTVCYREGKQYIMSLTKTY